MEYSIRPLRADEKELLNHFLYNAIYLPKGTPPPPKEIILQPELQVYVENFGEGACDHALVAQTGDTVVGAVWVRIMEDYGHVDAQTPSFAISVNEDMRGRGIGRKLMEGMLQLLKEKGIAQASLAVQKENYAVKLYRSMGFETIRETEEEYIMVRRL